MADCGDDDDDDDDGGESVDSHCELMAMALKIRLTLTLLRLAVAEYCSLTLASLAECQAKVCNANRVSATALTCTFCTFSTLCRSRALGSTVSWMPSIWLLIDAVRSTAEGCLGHSRDHSQHTYSF